ncbi:MAG: ATP-binding protein [Myxococcaceae bacterium]|nr:ATP-binding protein [Myxococcaceae bacterium]MCI0669790.1 ATP-binding protein [Myxococcaceae bacterium]
MALVLVAGVWTPTARAISPERALTQLHHRAWQVEDGLPQNSAHALARTPDGYLWFGTWEGLVRFDGAQFTVFDRNNTPALRGRAVRTLTVASDGTLWLGGDEGLVRMRDGVFTALAPPPDGPALRNVRGLLASGDALWVATRGHGLWRWQSGAWRHWSTEVDGAVWDLFRLAEDGRGTLWVASSRGLLRLRDGEVLEPVPLPQGELPVDTVVRGRDGTVWAGVRGGHLLRVHPDGRIEPRSMPPMGGHDIDAILEDAHGTLWLGTSNGGLMRLVGDRLMHLTAEQGLVSGTVLALLEDTEGNLWVGTDGGGLHRLNEGVAVPLGVSEGLPVPMAQAVYQSRDGALWLGTDGGGVARLLDGRLTVLDARSGLHTNQVRAIGESSDGSMWLGGRAGGLTRLSGGKLTPWGPAQGVSWNHVNAFAEDEAGDFFVATDRGLARRVGERFELLTKAHGLPSNDLAMMAPARGGGLWLATDRGGLVRYRGGRFEVVHADGGPIRTLVMALHEDDRGALWVGTKDGLFRFQGGTLVRFGREHGLFDDLISAVVEDAKGHLWMSCNRGVFRVARSELEEVAEGRRTRVTSRVYGMDDGMPSAECNGMTFPTGWRTRDGRLWFPTIRGMVAFQEEESTRHTARLPPVRVEAVTVDGTPVSTGDVLTLRSDAQQVELHYTAPWLRSPEQVHFRYQLEGVDADWVEAEGRRTAYYTHLPPGTFHFRVMARRSDGPWEETGAAQLRLVVLPQLHETLWFRLVAALSLAGLVAGGVAWRLHHHRCRQRELEARVHERTAELAATNAQLDAQVQALQEAKERLVHAEKMAAVGTLAAGVGHEINNPLAYILNNVSFLHARVPRLLAGRPLAGEEKENAAAVERALADTLEGVERVRRIVKDLRTFSRVESEKRVPVRLEEVLEVSLAIAANQLRQRARVVRRFEPVPPVLGDPHRMGQLFLNLLVNAAQAIPEGQAERHEVRVSLREERGGVVVEVEDTGIGIPAEVVPRIFEPFFTTKPVGEGTGLGLSICHAIVQSHGGDIQVHSHPDHGTTFRVTLPALVPGAATGT